MSSLGNKKIMSQNISRLMKSKGVTRNKMSDDLAISYTTLTDWIKGNTYPRIDKIELMSQYFGVPKSTLIEPENSLHISDKVNAILANLSINRQKKVLAYSEHQYQLQNNQPRPFKRPKQDIELYGAVSAGTGEYLSDEYRETISYEGIVPDHDYAVIVNGDSMLPLFEDKQIIFVKKGTDIRSGQIVIANYDQQAYVKKFVSDDIGARFVSLNKKYDDMPIDANHETSILGVVVL
ncbi:MULTISPECIES: S24 family peptidase [unclassified Leuconostoc]|uniref:S24 family peptidase n=1 Tax=unclassified Leuconostoc TaxID=2685106 RepID=UPI001906B352|nr:MULTISPECIES: S24 family peptidase [unclassified Leuconostoc]MBK0040876.1 LexA family transcriptional regulator [Leuconostoc sp. S51]MBK0051425.1 LexA family transcriptional regulator [Leuconostoc sp. S50]